MTATKCIEEIRSLGGMIDVNNDDEMMLILPPGAPVPLLAYIMANREKLKAALRPRTWLVSPVDDDALERWRSVMARDMLEVLHVRIHTKRGYMEVDYLPRVDEWVIYAELEGDDEQ